jgi:hypothetical protein
VSVLWHHDVSPKIKRVYLPGLVDRFHEPHSAAIFGQKRTPAKARERQRMGVPRFIESSTRLPVFVHSEARLAECGCKLGGDHILP